MSIILCIKKQFHSLVFVTKCFSIPNKRRKGILQDPLEALHLMNVALSVMNSDGPVKAQMPLRQIKSILFFQVISPESIKGDRLREININFKEPYYILCQNTASICTPVQINKLFKHPMKAFRLGVTISRFSVTMKNITNECGGP